MSMNPILPDFRAAAFEKGAPIDNPYFPVTPGTIRSYSGSKEEGGEIETESNDLFVTFETKKIKGVETTVVRDTAYHDGVLVEDTLDWYAQDADGNVWYLGEIAYNYRYDDEGDYTSTDTDGSWTAGKGGAKPGWIMPAQPEVGDSYYQEFARGIAEDEGRVEAVDEEVTIALDTYNDVLKTLDTTALEPTAREFKYYAPGVGQVLAEEGLNAQNEADFVVELQGTRQVVKDDDDDDAEDDDDDDDDNDADDADDEAGEGDHEFDLSDLSDGQPLAGADQADGPDADDFGGEGADKYVTVLGGTTDLDDALGAYTFDLHSGRIREGMILYASSEEIEAGDSFALKVRDGKGLGLFAVADGGELGVDLSTYEDGGLFFRNILTGRKATIDDGLAPLVFDSDGTPLPIQPLHVVGNDDGFNFLNPVAGVHAVELESEALGEEDDVVLLSFEDRRVTDPDWDGDYNDLIVAVSEEPLSADLVESLLAELPSGPVADALIA
jgi:hypothetical protein